MNWKQIKLTRIQEKQFARWRVRLGEDLSRKLDLLKRQRVITVGKLVERIPQLSVELKELAIEIINIMNIRQAIPALLELTADKSVRVFCAERLGWMKSGRKQVVQYFIGIGHRELVSPNPDIDWLHAVLYGLAHANDPCAAEVLLSVFERLDLPGWLRGEAADKVGHSFAA
jgi:hypothetical protein